jgi:hypothetical protein
MLDKFLKQSQQFKTAFSKQILKLVASAFGLVAALAWNEVIKEAVAIYVKPVAGKSSGLISLLIYAFIVTILAVFITYYLTKAVGKDTS